MVELPAPTTETPYPAFAQLWVYEAEYTRYRAIVVDLPVPLEDDAAIFPPRTYILVEPASGRRTWLPVTRDGMPMAEEFIQEKTGAIGVDAHCLTTLIAAVMGVRPIYDPDTIEPLEEHVGNQEH